jgi:hypothetical protein
MNHSETPLEHVPNLYEITAKLIKGHMEPAQWNNWFWKLHQCFSRILNFKSMFNIGLVWKIYSRWCHDGGEYNGSQTDIWFKIYGPALGMVSLYLKCILDDFEMSKIQTKNLQVHLHMLRAHKAVSRKIASRIACVTKIKFGAKIRLFRHLCVFFTDTTKNISFSQWKR